MDSFERREAKLRAQEKWAVVRKSVLPEKDEFLEKYLLNFKASLLVCCLPNIRP